MNGPLLTPPEHISPRFRRQPLPRRWRNQNETSPFPTNRPGDWNRPNPFTCPPQIAQDSREVVIQSVSRWLENISLDPAPVEEQEETGLLDLVEEKEQVH